MRHLRQSLAFATLLVACAPRVVTTTSSVRTQVQPTSAQQPQLVSSATAIDGVEIASIKRQWETEWVEAAGVAPLRDKYPGEVATNRRLAATGAETLAKQKLYELVGDVQIAGRTYVRDFMTTTESQQKVLGLVREARTVSETWNKVEGGQEVTVVVRMPKAVLLTIIQTELRYKGTLAVRSREALGTMRNEPAPRFGSRLISTCMETNELAAPPCPFA